MASDDRRPSSGGWFTKLFGGETSSHAPAPTLSAPPRAPSQTPPSEAWAGAPRIEEPATPQAPHEDAPDADFDEAWYLAQNPGVAAGVAQGDFASGHDHYLRFGQHEGRRKRAAAPTLSPAAAGDYDEAWYLAQNPGVAASVQDGLFASGYDHYLRHGKAEGRAGKPTPGGLPG